MILTVTEGLLTAAMGDDLARGAAGDADDAR